MNIPASIVGLIQRVDLESQTTENMIELALSDGSHLMLPVEEQDVERLLHMAVGATPPPVARTPVHNTSSQPPLPPTDEVHVFDGVGPPAAEVSAVAIQFIQQVQSSLPPAVQAGSRLSSYTNKEGVRTPIRTISTVDEMGNPVLPGLDDTPPDDGDDDGTPEA
jgi:hypothetical protein